MRRPPETEFSYGGEAHIERPRDPQALSDEEWAAFLFTRANAKGAFRERWVHTHGCRRFFNVLRDTVSHEIFASYKAGEAGPANPPATAARPGTAKSPARKPARRTGGGKRS